MEIGKINLIKQPKLKKIIKNTKILQRSALLDSRLVILIQIKYIIIKIFKKINLQIKEAIKLMILKIKSLIKNSYKAKRSMNNKIMKKEKMKNQMDFKCKNKMKE